MAAFAARQSGSERLERGIEGKYVALCWCRLDCNVPYVFSNLFVRQQKSNRFRRYDDWKSALVLYRSMGRKLCHDHCQSRVFLHERSRLHQMGGGAALTRWPAPAYAPRGPLPSQPRLTAEANTSVTQKVNARI